MSEAARTILIVTDDLIFSSQISELMLRAGARTLRFASSCDALEVARGLTPNFVLLHVPSEQLAAGWECYAALRSDRAIATIPILLYTPPCEQERAVGAAAGVTAHAEHILAQISVLTNNPEQEERWLEDGKVQWLPTGRDDL